jgi:hypothetical protein
VTTVLSRPAPQVTPPALPEEPHVEVVTTPPARTVGFDTIIWALVLLGGALRVRQWWFDRSIWADEAAVADTVIGKGYLGLMHPGTSELGAPLGFLWLVKTATEIFGDSERALRLVPLLSGIGALVLAALLVRRLLRPVAGILVMVVLAVAQPMVYYSSSLKAYETDAAAVAGILLMTIMMMHRELRFRSLVWWALVCSVCALCSHPALFAVAASAAVLAFRFIRRRERQLLFCLLGVSAAWLGVAITQYVLTVHSLQVFVDNDGYWAPGLPPSGSIATGLNHWVSVIHWIGLTCSALVTTPVGLPLSGIVLALFVVGAVRMARHLPFVLSVIGIIVVLAFIAALARLYPLQGRSAMFLVIPFMLVVGAAIGPRLPLSTADGKGAHARQLPNRPQLVLSAVAGLALVGVTVSPVRAAVTAVQKPYVTLELRPAMQFVMENYVPGDSVFISNWNTTTALYYHYTMGLPISGVFQYTDDAGCTSGAAVSAMRSDDPVWLLFGYPPRIPGFPVPGDTVKNVEGKLQALGSVVGTYNAPGHATAVLINPLQPTADPHPDHTQGCVQAARFPGTS